MGSIPVMALVLGLVAASIFMQSPVHGYAGGEGLVIVVTFPSLADDVAQLVCNDTVVPLVPPGADPHTYHLKPGDVELLKNADLVVSTRHTFLELGIRELKERGLVKGRLIELPGIPGVTLLRNPETNNINLHMPIYDLDNYRRFVMNISVELMLLNPRQASCYAERLGEVLSRVSSLYRYWGAFKLRAVADLPFTQYAVSWMGVEVEHLVLAEHGLELSPRHLQSIEQELSSGSVDLVLVSSPSEHYASKWLEGAAARYGVPVVYIPTPMTRGSVVDKLEYVLEQLLHLEATSTPPPNRGVFSFTYSENARYILAASYASAAVIVLLIYIARSRGGAF